MKHNLLRLSLLLCLTLASSAFACGSNGDCVQSSCGYECDRCSPCHCADRGWSWNTCMSKSEYCEAFGNVGEEDYNW